MASENGGSNSNTYEEARRLRLQENKKKFEDLGILDLSKGLSNLTTPGKKIKQRLSKPKSATTEVVEPRRSTRTRNAVVSYSDHMDIDLPPLRKRFKSSSFSWTSYVARPLDEVKLAAYEDRIRALRAAEEFQTSIQSGNPSFVKSMVRSHVYSCFWLGLPTQFCKNHLPKKDLDMILEDENGTTYDAKYLGNRTGLSGGWRGFALDHRLDDGDAVVFELVEPDKFKVYTFRISSLLSTKTHTIDEEGSPEKNTSKGRKGATLPSAKTSKPKKAEANQVDESLSTEKPQQQERIASEENIEDKYKIQKNGFVDEDDGEKIDSIERNGLVPEDDSKNIDLTKENSLVSEENVKRDDESGKNEEVNLVDTDKKEKQGKPVGRPRKKPAPRLFRKK